MKSKLRLFTVIIAALLVIVQSACIKTMQPDTAISSDNQSVLEQNSYYYTGNEGGSITKVDAGTNKVVNTITVEGSIHNVQISPNGKVLGATLVPKMDMHGGHESMAMGGYALFYDIATDKLIQRVQVGEHPAHIVFTHNGKFALVSNNGSNNVSVINAKTYKVIKTIPTGAGPHGFRISKDNKFAYVANLAEDTVSVLDLVKFKEVKKIKVGKGPVTTGITNNGKTLLVTLSAENALAIVDLTTGRINKVPVGNNPAQLFIQYNDKYAFVANQGTVQNPSDTVSKIDLSTRKVVAAIKVGKGPHGVVISNNNKFVYVTNMFEDTVSVIDSMKNTIVATVKVGKTPNGITYKP